MMRWLASLLLSSVALLLGTVGDLVVPHPFGLVLLLFFGCLLARFLLDAALRDIPCARCEVRDGMHARAEQHRRRVMHWRTPWGDRGCDRGDADAKCTADLAKVQCEGCLHEARRVETITRTMAGQALAGTVSTGECGGELR